VVSEPLDERVSAAAAASLVGEDPTRRTEHPQQRLVAVCGHGVKAAPGDEQGLGEHVRRVLRRARPPGRVGEHARADVVGERREALLATAHEALPRPMPVQFAANSARTGPASPRAAGSATLVAK
jgi:hypothetical protein